MFRKKFETAVNSEVSFMAIIAITIAIIGSIFFGLILNLHDWYAYTLRAMIFAPFGYWFARHDGDNDYFEEEKISVKGKIIVNVICIVVLTLLLLFTFGMVLSVTNLWIMTISCIVPFAIALFAFTKWKDEKVETTDHSAECPYEIEKPENENS